MHSNPWARSLLVVASVAAIGATAGCAKKDTPRLVYEERPVELLYTTGADRLDRRQWNQAIDYFREVERQHPYSEWSRRAILMTGYAHYMGNNYSEAIADADRFISLYPGNSSAVYAYYLKAICYFEQIVDVGRDQAATEQANQALQDVVRRYPNSEYAQDARLKIDMVNDQLAGREMLVGRYYLRRNDPIAAIGRFRTVVEKYQTTSHTAEALYRLVEAYVSMGLMEEAKRNGAVLGHNYPGDVWYQDAYALLTTSGAEPAVTPTRAGDQRRGVRWWNPFRRGSALPPPSSDGVAAPAVANAPATPPPANRRKGFLHRMFGL